MATILTPYDPHRLLRLKDVLKLLPISKSNFWAGVKSGRYPKSLKMGPRTTAWRAADIYALIDGLNYEVSK